MALHPRGISPVYGEGVSTNLWVLVFFILHQDVGRGLKFPVTDHTLLCLFGYLQPGVGQSAPSPELFRQPGLSCSWPNRNPLLRQQYLGDCRPPTLYICPSAQGMSCAPMPSAAFLPPCLVSTVLSTRS